MKLDLIPGKNGALEIQILSECFEDGQRITVIGNQLVDSPIRAEVPGGIRLQLAKVRVAKPKPTPPSTSAPDLDPERLKLTEAIAMAGLEAEPCPDCQAYTLWPVPQEAKNHLKDNGSYCCLVCGEKLKSQGQPTPDTHEVV